jgi:hypothetical protein
MGTGFRSVEDIFLVFGPFYEEVREVGCWVLFVFLTLALIREFLQSVGGKSDYTGLLTRGILIAGAIAVYTPFFHHVIHGMDLLANFFMPDEDFKRSMEQVFIAFRQDKDLGMIALMKMTFIEWLIQGTYNLAYAVIRAFTWIRLIFLSALYLIGPIMLGVGIFLPKMATGWIRWIFEVASWKVVLALFVRILVEMNFFEVYAKATTPGLDLFAMNLIIIFIIILFVPLFSAMMIRGTGSFSGAGGAVLGLGGALAIKQITRGARAVSNQVTRPPQSSSAKTGGGLSYK